MTATIDRIPTSERLTSPPARLSTTPAGSAPGFPDGAWWPRSRDLLRELPALVHVLDERWMANEDTSREAQEPLGREGERETEGGHATAAAGDPKPPGCMSCVGGM
ncbi:DUF5994 family protein [Streptomyces sp. NPDC019208]|uniref:DUF5994 family protein n=1 Tax=unclassified Streptomyces TaxID=2593676 RepID=UPI0033DE3A09